MGVELTEKAQLGLVCASPEKELENFYYFLNVAMPKTKMKETLKHRNLSFIFTVGTIPHGCTMQSTTIRKGKKSNKKTWTP